MRLGEAVEVSGLRTAHALAGGTGTGALGGRPPALGRLRLWLGVAVFVAVAGFGWQQWKAVQQVREFEELDTKILSSDLPIDAYLDRGFRELAQGLVRTLMAAAAAGVLLAAASVTHAQITLKSPAWAELSPQEKQILAPLAPDWDKLDASRKAKWRGVAQRYPTMKPDEQQRMQQQMRSWASLTPEQRNAAREQYKTMTKLPPDKEGGSPAEVDGIPAAPPPRPSASSQRRPRLPPARPRAVRRRCARPRRR